MNRRHTREIKIGDRVHHRLFGDGTVTDTLPIGDDTVVTIEFDSGSRKKLCAVISKLELIETEHEKEQP